MPRHTEAKVHSKAHAKKEIDTSFFDFVDSCGCNKEKKHHKKDTFFTTSCDSTSSDTCDTTSTTCDTTSTTCDTSSSTCDTSSSTTSCDTSSSTCDTSSSTCDTSTTCDTTTHHHHHECEEEKICFTIKHGKCGPCGPCGPCGKKGEKGDKGERGERGPKGCDGKNGKDGCHGNHGCDGKNIANNLTFNGCLVFVIDGEYIKKLDKRCGKVVGKAKLPKGFAYEGITSVNGEVWITARKRHDDKKCGDDTYLFIYDVESDKFEKPKKI